MIADIAQLTPGKTRVRYDSQMLADLGYVGVVTALDPERPHEMRVRCDNDFELTTSTSYWSIDSHGGTS